MPLGVLAVLLSFFAFLIGLEASSPGIAGNIVRATALMSHAVKHDIAGRTCTRSILAGYKHACQ